ncbi:hypothetical protein ABW19_dt0205406 [Dactylella cylindrospora]|nr:hypothetical protein ABW19_dt0205406 [Dactylella cylindrospora]
MAYRQTAGNYNASIQRQPATILSLPNELLLEILKYHNDEYPANTYRSLRLTCARFNDLTTPLFFSAWTFRYGLNFKSTQFYIDLAKVDFQECCRRLYCHTGVDDLQRVVDRGYHKYITTLNLLCRRHHGSEIRYLLRPHANSIPGGEGRLPLSCPRCKVSVSVCGCPARRWENAKMEQPKVLVRVFNEGVKTGGLRRVNILIEPDQPKPKRGEVTPNYLDLFVEKFGMVSPDRYTGDLVLSAVNHWRLNFETLVPGISKLLTRLRIIHDKAMSTATANEIEPYSELQAFLVCLASGGRLRELLLDLSGKPYLNFIGQMKFQHLQQLHLSRVRIPSVTGFVNFLQVHAKLTALSLYNIILKPTGASNWMIVLHTIKQYLLELTDFYCECTDTWRRSTGCDPWRVTRLGQAELDCEAMCDLEYQVDKRRFTKELRRIYAGIRSDELERKVDRLLSDRWEGRMYNFKCQLFVEKWTWAYYPSKWGDEVVDKSLCKAEMMFSKKPYKKRIQGYKWRRA